MSRMTLASPFALSSACESRVGLWESRERRTFCSETKANGTFEDVTAQAGVTDKALYYGFSVAWVDLDDDGKLD